ncbi:transcriptional regulator [Nanoarchaeota archaeon]
MKKLIFPQEIEVWYILPAIRKYMALELIKSGLNQSQVSKLLDCSRASINQYTKQQRGQEILNSKIKQEIKKSSSLIINNKSNVFQEIMRVNQIVKNTGLLCQLHKKLGLAKCSCQSDCHLED